MPCSCPVFAPDDVILPGGGVAVEGIKEEDDEDSHSAVVEREGEVDEDLVGGALRHVRLLHDVVDVLWRGLGR